MRIIFLVFKCIVFLQLSAISQNNLLNYPKIGDSIKFYKKISAPYRLINRNGSSVLVCDYMHGGIKYAISDYLGKAFYIYTKDTSFYTSDGVTIGSSLTKIIELDSTYKVLERYKMGYYIKLKSGWEAFFTTNDSHSTVKSFSRDRKNGAPSPL